MGRLILLLCLSSSAAFAQDAAPAAPPPSSEDGDQARAKELFENGATLYREGSYEAAILAFEEAFRLSRRPALLLNIANAQERLANWKSARDTLERYRALSRAEEREAIERRIANLDERLAEERARAEEARRRAELGAAAATTSAAEIGPTPAPPPPRRRDGRGRRTAGYALLGAGVAIGGGFGSVAGWSWARSRTFLDQGDQASWDQLRPLNNASFGLAVGGGALALTGIILAALPVEDSRAVPVTAISPQPDGATMSLTWTLR